MNNVTAKTKIENCVNLLLELSKNEKFTPNEQKEIEKARKILIPLCSKEKETQFNKIIDYANAKNSFNKLIKYSEKLLKSSEEQAKTEKEKIKKLKEKKEKEHSKENTEKLKTEIEKSKQKLQKSIANISLLDDALTHLKIPETELERFLTFMIFVQRNNPLKNYIKNGKDAGAAFKIIEELVGLKRAQIIDRIKIIINEAEINGTLELEINYKEKKSFDNRIDNIRYNVVKSPYRKKENRNLWNIMLTALKQCIDETGIIQLDMPTEPHEYFRTLCLVYYVLDYAENITK